MDPAIQRKRMKSPRIARKSIMMERAVSDRSVPVAHNRSDSRAERRGGMTEMPRSVRATAGKLRLGVKKPRKQGDQAHLTSSSNLRLTGQDVTVNKNGLNTERWHRNSLMMRTWETLSTASRPLFRWVGSFTCGLLEVFTLNCLDSLQSRVSCCHMDACVPTLACRRRMFQAKSISTISFCE